MSLQASIIIPSYHRTAHVFDTLGLLVPMANAAQAEIVLVDQTGYDPGQIDEMAASCHFQYVRLHKPNLPAARNAGAQIAKGNILLFIDDDATPEPGWLEHHLAAYQDPKIGCVGGRVIDANAKGVSDKPVIYDDKTGEYTTDFGCLNPQETISIPGGNCSVRRSVWDQVKFDPAYKANAYFEEVDFAFRVRKAGWKIWYEPQASVVHHLAAAGGCRRALAVEVYHRFRNYALFYFRHTPQHLGYYFYKKEKRFAEYISRKPGKGHSAKIVLSAMLGSAVGTALGLAKHLRDP